MLVKAHIIDFIPYRTATPVVHRERDSVWICSRMSRGSGEEISLRIEPHNNGKDNRIKSYPDNHRHNVGQWHDVNMPDDVNDLVISVILINDPNRPAHEVVKGLFVAYENGQTPDYPRDNSDSLINSLKAVTDGVGHTVPVAGPIVQVVGGLLHKLLGGRGPFTKHDAILSFDTRRLNPQVLAIEVRENIVPGGTTRRKTVPGRCDYAVNTEIVRAA